MVKKNEKQCSHSVSNLVKAKQYVNRTISEIHPQCDSDEHLGEDIKGRTGV